MGSDNKQKNNKFVQGLKPLNEKLNSVHISHEVWEFIIFLTISTTIWVLVKSGENRHDKLEYEINITNAPKDLSITLSTDKVLADVSGSGITYLFSQIRSIFNSRTVIDIDYESFTQTLEGPVLEPHKLKEIIEKQTYTGVEIRSTSPERITMKVENNIRKVVPVIYNPHILLKDSTSYKVYDSRVAPTSVAIEAPQSILDTLSAIYVADSVFSNVNESFEAELPLKQIPNVKILKESVTVNVEIDLLTYDTRKVKITAEQLPANTHLTTFPDEVEVAYMVRSSVIDSITSEDFKAVVTYDKRMQTGHQCEVRLQTSPKSVKVINIKPRLVEYMIEQ